MSELSGESEKFYAYGPAHLSVLLLTVSAAFLMIILTRSGWRRTSRSFEVFLAVILFMEWPVNLLVAWRTEGITANNALPFQFCDVAAIVGGLALLTRQSELCELLYFWGLAGTAQGLITPALSVNWPHPRFVTFFMLHAGVVMAAVQVVFARGKTPRRGAVSRAFGWLFVYAVSAGVVNVVIRLCGGTSNYGFLCEKPPTASLLNILGPWPWYIGAIGVMAWISFSVLDLPFMIARKLGKKNHA